MAAEEDHTSGGEGEAPVEVKKGIPMSEVEKHASIDDLWLVIGGEERTARPSIITRSPRRARRIRRRRTAVRPIRRTCVSSRSVHSCTKQTAREGEEARF